MLESVFKLQQRVKTQSLSSVIRYMVLTKCSSFHPDVTKCISFFFIYFDITVKLRFHKNMQPAGFFLNVRMHKKRCFVTEWITRIYVIYCTLCSNFFFFFFSSPPPEKQWECKHISMRPLDFICLVFLRN